MHVYPYNHCNTLQHTATHCNTLQHTATPPQQSRRETSKVLQCAGAFCECVCVLLLVSARERECVCACVCVCVTVTVQVVEFSQMHVYECACVGV